MGDENNTQTGMHLGRRIQRRCSSSDPMGREVWSKVHGGLILRLSGSQVSPPIPPRVGALQSQLEHQFQSQAGRWELAH